VPLRNLLSFFGFQFTFLSKERAQITSYKKINSKSGTMAYICNPSYLGGEGPENFSSRLGKKLETPISKQARHGNVHLFSEVHGRLYIGE
jgi:hypothetical protein